MSELKSHFEDYGRPFCRHKRSVRPGSSLTLVDEWDRVTCKRCLREGWYWKLHDKWEPEYGNSCGKGSPSKETIMRNYERIAAKQREDQPQ
jgi:hypothetical protein